MPVPETGAKLDDIAAAVGEAGALALHHWRPGAAPDAKVWEKSKGHPVCDADMAVDRLLHARLSAILPDAGWLSEETADNPERLAQRLLWCVDPIDGTRDYIRGRSGWCVSAALIADGLPYLAVISAPARQQLWVAKAGAGARCNGEILRASARSEFSGSRVPADELPHVDRDLTMVEKPNSIAMRMMMVACDRADLVASLGSGHEWDVAGAHLVVQEAGAMVTDARGGPLRYNKPNPVDFGLVCSAPAIHAAAVERLAARAAAARAAAG